MSEDASAEKQIFGLLAADRAIRNQLATFSMLIDGKRWAEMDRVFDEDVAFDYGADDKGVGIAALRSTFERYLGGPVTTQHLIGSILVDLEEDCARSEACVQARHRRDECADLSVFDTNGRYYDKWRQVGGKWMIVERVAHWAINHGNPEILEMPGPNPASIEGASANG